MNFTKYVNKKEKPYYLDEYLYTIIINGEVIFKNKKGSKLNYIDCRTIERQQNKTTKSEEIEVKTIPNPEYTKELAAYEKQEAKLTSKFWKDTFESLGIDPNFPKAELFKKFVFEHCDDSNIKHEMFFEQAYNFASELIELLK